MYKRTLAFLLALCMIISVCPITALAAETDDAADSGTFQFTYINPLYADVVTEEDLNDAANQPSTKSVVKDDTEYSTTIEEAGASMRRGLRDRYEDVSVNYATPDLEMTEDAVGALVTDIFYSAIAHTGNPTEGDYLMWQFSGWNCNIGVQMSDSVYYLEITYTLTYYTDHDQEEKVTEAVDKLLDELVVSGMTDYQKVKAAYDWICANVTYDDANKNDNNNTLKYTAYAALINKTAVCQGYALLLYRLALEMGVDCRLIPGTGNGESHGWNILKLSGKYYNADPTWDAGNTDYSWFLLSDESFTKHTRDAATDTNPEDYTSESFYAAYPMSDSNYVPTAEDLAVPEGGGDNTGDDNTKPDNSCGVNAVWTLEKGVLTISGTGAMTDYEENTDTPWYASIDSITAVVIEKGITHIGDNAFAQHKVLANIEIAESVTSIGTYALSGCTALTGVVLPEGLTELGGHVFQRCTALTSVVIPKGITVLSDMAFADCSALTEVTLPEGLTTLNQMAFSNCTALKEITFPATLTTIDMMAMFECSALREIYFRGDAPSFISSEAFSGVTATAYYPAGNATWTAGKLDNYDGTLTWVAYCPDGCTYKSVTTQATCTEAGKTTYTCTVCGAVVVENETPALGHNYVEGACIRCGEAEPTMVSPLVSGENVPATGKIKLTWEAVDYAVSYNVYRSAQKYDGYTLVGTVEDTSMVDDSAVAGTTYYYCVTSVSANGKESELPEDFDNYIVQCTCDLPQPKVSVGNVASTGKVKISWDAIDNAVEYKVYRSTSKSSGYSRISTTSKTSVTNTKNAEAGVTYYYKVIAIAENTEANSVYSEVKARTCDLPQPTVSVSNVASSGNVKISWEAVDGAVEYKVYRSTSKNSGYSRITTTSKTSVTNTKNCVAGETYYYKVMAIAEETSANSAYSEIKARTCDLAQPEITVSNSASSGKVKISWKAVDGATKYQVYRSLTGKDGSWSRISTTSSTSVTNTKNAEAGVTYYYKVRALCDESSATSAYSEVKARTCDLARPSVSITLNRAGKPKLTWDAVDGAVKYNVYRSATGETDSWNCIATVTGTGVTDNDTKISQTYYYKVVAIAQKSAANSAYSKVVFINCTSVDISGSTVETSVIDRINEYREYYGLEAVEWYTEGEMAAKIRVAELTVSFNLNRPDGSSPETLWEAYEIYDECVGSGFNNAVDLVDAIMSQEDTAAMCMYEEWTYAVAARNGDYWVVMFGAEDF